MHQIYKARTNQAFRERKKSSLVTMARIRNFQPRSPDTAEINSHSKEKKHVCNGQKRIVTELSTNRGKYGQINQYFVYIPMMAALKSCGDLRKLNLSAFKELRRKEVGL